MKNLRRPLSLIIILAMLCSLGSAALADEEIASEDEGETIQVEEILDETDGSADETSDDPAAAEKDDGDALEVEVAGIDSRSEMEDIATTAAEAAEPENKEGGADAEASSEEETDAETLQEEESAPAAEAQENIADAEEASEDPSDEPSDEVQAEITVLAAGIYDVADYVRLSLSSLGADFASGLVSGAVLTVDEDGAASLTLKLQVSQPLTLDGESCYAYIDASTSAPGYYDAAGNRHSATYTTTNKLENASLHTATDTDGNEERPFVDSLTIPVEEGISSLYLWLYVNSNALGIQFCDGSGTLSENGNGMNLPGVETAYKAVLTVNWDSILSAYGTTTTVSAEEGKDENADENVTAETTMTSDAPAENVASALTVSEATVANGETTENTDEKTDTVEMILEEINSASAATVSAAKESTSGGYTVTIPTNIDLGTGTSADYTIVIDNHTEDVDIVVTAPAIGVLTDSEGENVIYYKNILIDAAVSETDITLNGTVALITEPTVSRDYTGTLTFTIRANGS